ncbi:hypothetical protein [Herminiimonas arsenitoxidans]|uniref:hypothetical protein n=1 Tax=Herminiimonas arsenitoxidans TaxID=1809410 RepID=UPI0009713113|nr:hypothetical protein [Herminiimonas arsenitoxidans]
MSEKNIEGNNILLFTRSVKRPSPEEVAAIAASDLYELLPVYDRLIGLLRETYDYELDMLTDDIVLSVVRCRAALAKGMDDQTSLKMVKEMREGLREMPKTLRSLLPGLGPRLGESIEHKLGIRFSKY